MHDYLENLYDLCEIINREIKDANEKVRAAGGKVSAGDVDYIDKLTRSLMTTIAMIEHEDDDDYSEDGGSYNMGGSYARGGNRGGRSSNRGGNYGGASYARGRRNARRDSMGRYSREGGYSRDEAKDDMIDELRDLMGDAPDERIKQEFKRFISKVETM